MSEGERREFEAWVAEMDETARHPLTADDIATMEDEVLSSVVTRKIWAIVREKHRGWEKRLPRLSPGQRAIWATDWADDEVHNGGFHQYFYNSTGRFAPDALDGFRLLGLSERADVLERAMLVFLSEWPMQERVHTERNIETFAASYAETLLTELDPLFWEAAKREDLLEAEVRYIREHPEEFADG